VWIVGRDARRRTGAVEQVSGDDAVDILSGAAGDGGGGELLHPGWGVV
jgi:hypothetical protein